MFGFLKKNLKNRDDVINSIHKTIITLLPEKKYEKFSSGYIFLWNDFEGSGWSEGYNTPLSMLSFKVTDILGAHGVFFDDIFIPASELERSRYISLYCNEVHRYLLRACPKYVNLKFINESLSG